MPLRNNIKVYRAIHNLSQEKLSEMAGISRQTVGLIENERLVPSVLIALKIAKALDCKVNDIFSYSDDEEDTPNEANIGRSIQKNQKWRENDEN